ncbi:hypothetical protein DCO58_01910 [Helicobacter saguini]|uniref:ATP-binding protein n=1 Tax=Helicobacter saguini TaxID=1548018 RepID=A0A347W086_9HELI|nr:hypothetical protein [Helicobacter saguini]MWV62863.1 hypothetical protein [Helicobacter saguini]MWV66466.1 hypothetical protein [Helicobacter saguini]MWV68816.1 hypothetical protein [Helicobacter saguini]MWV71629.1 hypothetical protein [Helicobacter saguini]TLD94433.1 hypothetical protein LS64_005760 [Helicobacter saguini]
MNIVYIFIFLFSSFLFAKDSNMVSISGLQGPQAVVSNANNIYVSNAGIYKNNIKKESGFISRLDGKGKIVELKFIDNLDYPKGIAVLNNVLYVVDINTLKGFNLSTKKQVLNMQIKGANALSDIATSNDTLYVSDSKAGVIYAVDIKKKNYHVFIAIESSLGQPNGIGINGNFLYVGTSDSTRFETLKGNVFRIDLESKSVYLTSSYNSNIYGLEITKQGIIMLSGYDSNGDVRFYSITGDSKIFEVDLNIKLKSALYFTYSNDALWIPDSKQNRVFKVMP